NLKQKHSIETMATVCWWRLKAEEIRAEYDNFACSSARDTMAGVARCYDTMAEHLEHRLAREGGCLSSESSCYTRFAFRYRHAACRAMAKLSSAHAESDPAKRPSSIAEATCGRGFRPNPAPAPRGSRFRRIRDSGSIATNWHRAVQLAVFAPD